jgi:hypothetical protein
MIGVRLKPPSNAALAASNRETILSVRLWDGPPLRGDDYLLEYYEDGYPKLPSCLDRRAGP